MNSVVKQMFAVLMLLGALSGMVLAGSYKLTKPLIEKHRLEELQRSIFVVLPEATSYKEISSDDIQVYKGLKDDQSSAGYAFVAKGPGFQGTIGMMVGVDAKIQTLLGMQVLQQLETPGLGAKIAEDDFQAQFADLQPNWTDTISAASIEQANAGSEDVGAGQPVLTVADIPEFISYVKNIAPDDPNEIQAITGATISSVAVVSIINQHLYVLWEVVGDDIQ